jgi:UDP-glucose 4-epimerase
VFDNFSSGRKENLADLRGPLEVIVGDLRDKAQVAEAVRGVDFIFHQAAFVSVPKSMFQPQECFDINVQGTLNLFEAAKSVGVQAVVFASSTAIYGDTPELPLREETAPRPLSPYAASKQINEVYGSLYSRAFGLPTVALRYFNVYGPRQSPDSDYAAAIPIFIRRMLAGRSPTIFGDGRQSRDFIFVGDVVRANLLAAETPQAAGQVFNICTGLEINLMDLLEALSEIIPGAPVAEFAPPRPGDIYRSLGNPQRAAAALGFRAQVNLDEGLAQTVAAMRREFAHRNYCSA